MDKARSHQGPTMLDIIQMHRKVSKMHFKYRYGFFVWFAFCLGFCCCCLFLVLFVWFFVGFLFLFFSGMKCLLLDAFKIAYSFVVAHLWKLDSPGSPLTSQEVYIQQVTSWTMASP